MALPHPESAGHSLRGKLLALILLAFVPAVLLSLLNGWQYRDRALREGREETRAVARLAARDYEDLIFRTTPPLLRTLAELSPEVRAQDGPGASALLARMVAEYPQYINLMVARVPSGEVFASGVPSKKPLSLADRPYFRQALETRRYVVGEFALGKATGKPTVVCAQPVTDARGRVVAVVAAGVDVERLARQLAGVHPRREIGITIFDRRGKVLLATWAHRAWVGADASGSAVWRAIQRAGSEGLYRGHSMDGVRKLVAFRALSGPEGKPAAYVAATLPEREALAQADRLLRYTWVGFAASAAVAALGLLFIGRRSILGGVNALVAAAGRWAEGDLGARAGDAGDTAEFRQLARAFDAMAERLQEREAQQRTAEEALRESQERYQSLVDHIDLGITLMDSGYCILMANAGHGRILRRPASEVLGRECFRAIHGREAVCPDCPGARAMATGRPASRETGGRRADGTEFWVRVQSFPVLGPDGAARGFIEVVEDLTDARRLREEREQLERKMLQAQKLESLGVLAGGIAHDFNNLLVGILGNADLALARVAPDSPVRTYLQRIDAAAERAAGLTNQMLAYSGKGRFVVEAVDLGRLVGEMGHLLESVVSRSASVRYDLAEGLPAVEADATQLRQVVMNLLTNASDALGGRPGSIAVSTGVTGAREAHLAAIQPDLPPADDAYVYVSVADTGEGIAPEARERIFDPFYTTKQHGRGLGLAAVLGIVRGHRGALDVRSEPGRGTTFTVYLPASPALPAPGG